MLWFKTIDREFSDVYLNNKCKNNENDIETLKRKVSTLEMDIETLKNDYKKAVSKYNEFLYEKDEYIKTIRDRIEKKLDYHNAREEPKEKKKTFNQLLKERMEQNMQNGTNQPREIQ